jgi:DNA-binding transcriptional MerR regulator
MQYFSIKDIENLTGIKAHTLRIWEKRYKLIVSKRKDSNHRYFDNEDLKTILQITYLYETDFKISQIAKLSPEAIATFAHIDHSNSKTTEAYILQLINAIIEFDSNSFKTIFETAIKHFGIENAISEIAYGLLRRIGLLWLTNHMMPAQEHFASNLIKSRLLQAIEELPKKQIDSNQITVLFAPVGEFHEIPLLFIQYLFKRNKRRVCYLGTNTSLSDLSFCLERRPITHLYFHIITNLSGKTLDELVEELLNNFPDKTLVVSGPLSKKINIRSPKLICIQTMEQIMQFPIHFMNPELQN